MIGLTRLYCNQGERFLLIDVASEEAPKRAEELLNDGWEIEAAIPVWYLSPMHDDQGGIGAPLHECQAVIEAERRKLLD